MFIVLCYSTPFCCSLSPHSTLGLLFVFSFDINFVGIFDGGAREQASGVETKHVVYEYENLWIIDTKDCCIQIKLMSFFFVLWRRVNGDVLGHDV